MRAGGHLAYLPNVKLQRLQRYEDYGFEGEVPELGDATRIRREWVEDRYKWLGEDGKPQKP